MSSVDNRVVNLKFDNKEFVSNVMSTIKNLDNLKKSMDMDDAVDEFNKIDSAGKKTDFSNISNALEQIRSRFSAMGIIGMTVLQNITNSAIAAGKALIANLVNPIVQGGINRAMNIENAHFMLQGLISDEQEVQAIMSDASASVDGTAYSYDEAAKAAAQFAATGMRSGEKMQSTLRGVAGLTATANTEYSRVAQIYTTIAGNGRLMGDQLLQLSSLGINAAATLGKHFGKTEQEIREMVSDGKVSFEMFAEAMDSAFGEHAKAANETFNGAMANIKAALARIGAEFVSPLIVQNGPLVELFNDVRVKINEIKAEIGPFANVFVDAVKNIISYVRELLNALDASKLMQSLVKIMNVVLQVARTVGRAFGDIFPKVTADTIRSLVDKFADFANKLQITYKQTNQLRSILRGFFSIFSIGGQVIGAIVRLLGNLLSTLSPLGKGLFDNAAKFGDFLTQVDKCMKETGVLNTIIDKLTSGFQKLCNIVKNVVGFIAGIGAAFASGVKAAKDYAGSTEAVSDSMSLLEKVGNGAKAVLDALKSAFEKVAPVVNRVAETLGKGLGKIVEGIKSLFSGNFDFTTIIDTLNAFLFGGILVAITSFVKSAKDAVDQMKGIAESLGGVFQALAEAIKGGGGEDEKALDPKEVLMFAGAIAVLAGAVFLLSSIDPYQLTQGLAGLAVMMAELIKFMDLLDIALAGVDTKAIAKIALALIPLSVALLIFTKSVKALGSMDLVSLAKGLGGTAVLMASIAGMAKLMEKSAGGFAKAGMAMLPFAAGMLILAQAVKQLGSLDLESLAKGLGGIGVMMLELAAFMKLGTFGKLSISQATGILVLAAALNVLAIAVKQLSSMGLKELIKGLYGVGVMLVELVAFMALVEKAGSPKNMISMGTGLIFLGSAMLILTQSVKQLGQLSLREIAKGLLALGGALAMVARGLELMPKGSMVNALALVAISGAITVLGIALKKFSQMSVVEIGKGLGVLAGSLAAIAGALKLMQGGIPGALALIMAATALGLLTPQLLILGTMNIVSIVTALGVLAATLGVLGVGAKLLAPVIPALMGLSIALGLVGAACLAFGAGTLALATGLAMIASAGKGVVEAITGILGGIISLIPTVGKAIIDLVGVLLQGFIDTAPLVFQAVTTLIQGIATTIISCAPFIFTALTSIISGILTMLTTLIPQVVTLVSTLLSQLLQMVITLLPQMAEAVAAIIQMVLTVITENIGAIVEAGISIILAILQGIRDHIFEMVTIAVEIVTNFINGIAANIGSVIQSAFNLIISFINGLADAIRNNSGSITDACWNLVSAIIEAIAGFGADIMQAGADLLQGFIDGIGNAVGGAIETVTGFFGNIVDGVKGFLGIHSPSTVFMGIGDNTSQGFIDGVKNREGDANLAGTDMAQAAIDGVNGVNTLAGSAGQDLGAQAAAGMQSSTSDLSQTGSASAQSFVDGIRQQAGAAQEAGAQVGTNATNGVRSTQANMQPLGSQSAHGFVAGFQSQSGAAQSAGQQVGRGAIAGLRSCLSDLTSIGKAFGAAFVNGLRQSVSQAQAAGKAVAEAAKKGLEEISAFVTGQAFSDGFANGISDKTWYIQQKAREAARAAKDAADSELRVGSPSKEMMETGRWGGIGLGLGFVDAIPYIKDKASESAKAAMVAISDTISEAAYAIPLFEDGITIRPEMDLSGIEKGSEEVNKIFDEMNKTLSSGSVAVHAQAISSNDPNSNKPIINDEDEGKDEPKVVNNIFNQTIKSPKAVDRLTIYRNTKNLFAQKVNGNVKGTVTANA